MSNIKEQLIKLGSEQPRLQKHIRPVLDSLIKVARIQWDQTNRAGRSRWTAATDAGMFMIEMDGSRFSLTLHHGLTDKTPVGGPYASVDDAKRAAEDYVDSRPWLRDATLTASDGAREYIKDLRSQELLMLYRWWKTNGSVSPGDSRVPQNAKPLLIKADPDVATMNRDLDFGDAPSELEEFADWLFELQEWYGL